MHILLGGPVAPALIKALSQFGAVEVLPSGPAREAFLKDAARFDCLVWPPFIGVLPPSLVESLPSLRHIATMGAGYETIDTGHAASRGICVSNTPRAVTDDTADAAFYLVLATVRQFPAAERYLRAGRWTLEAPFPRSASLHGKTLGIVGYGRIGAAIAQRAKAFGLDIVYHSRKPRADAPWRYAASIDEAARLSDILLCMLPGGDNTRNAIGASAFEALGPKGFFISVGRGSAVDEDALVTALQAGTIAGAGFDVFANEPHVPAALIGMENVVLLPHVGGATENVIVTVGRDLLENLSAVAAGKAPPDAVPEAPWSGARAPL